MFNGTEQPRRISHQGIEWRGYGGWGKATIYGGKIGALGEIGTFGPIRVTSPLGV